MRNSIPVIAACLLSLAGCPEKPKAPRQPGKILCTKANEKDSQLLREKVSMLPGKTRDDIKKIVMCVEKMDGGLVVPISGLAFDKDGNLIGKHWPDVSED